jgi:DMSO/TMAO reductase YedYZ heme-binding membrane subunit
MMNDASTGRTAKTRGSCARTSLAFVFVLAVLAVPFALLNSNLANIGAGMDETLHTLSRLAALLGMCALFLQIMTGAFRPVLRRYFRPRRLQLTHTSFGVAAFSLLVVHFALLIPSLGEHWGALNHGFFVLGPIMLFTLLVALSAALLRRFLPGVWSRLHVLSYVVFTVGMVHALAIGTQTTMVAARAIFAVFIALALAGLAYRASHPEWRRRMAPQFVRVRTRDR